VKKHSHRLFTDQRVHLSVHRLGCVQSICKVLLAPWDGQRGSRFTPGRSSQGHCMAPVVTRIHYQQANEKQTRRWGNAVVVYSLDGCT
jgi:hypothetical protein